MSSDWTYNNGWTVQDYLNSIRNIPVSGDQTAEVPQYQSFQSMGITDPQQMLNTPIMGGMTPSQSLAQFGVTDPMNQLGMRIPDAMQGSLIPSGNDLGGMMLALAPLAMMVGGAAGVGGLSNAGMGAGGAAGASLAEEAAMLGVGPEVMGTQGLTAGTAFMPLAEEAAALGVGPEVFGTQGLEGMGGTFGGLTSGGGFSLPDMPSLPSGTGSVAQQIAKALTGGSAAATRSGGALIGQSAIAPQAGYVRKPRAPLTQPAFLGEQGQQPLGAAEDEMFNQAVASHGDDVSTRSRQMAAQLRGRPGWFAWKT